MFILSEAVNYFRSRNGFNRLFLEFEKRYKGLERIGGHAIITNATEEELKAIRGVIGEKIKIKGNKIEVPLIHFEQKLQETKFAGITLLELLDGYFGTKVITNKEKIQAFDDKKAQFLEEIYQEQKSVIVSMLYEKIKQKKPGTLQIHALFQSDEALLNTYLSYCFKAINALPLTEPRRLPLFSSEITGNPHFFDLKTEAGRLFVSLLQLWLENEGGRPYKSSPNAEEITDLLSYFGIWRDDVLNFVTCFGLRGFKENGEPFKVLDAANEEMTFCNLPLRDVFRLKKVEAPSSIVFVVENSSLYSSLVDSFQKKKNIPGLMCTHGQIKLSSLRLLDKLAETVEIIYYSGDHDPDGLSIGQNLVNRLGEKVTLWRFDEKSYLSSLSEDEFTSVKKLENIYEPQLQGIKNAMLIHKKSAYQEKLVDSYLKDINEILQSKASY